LTTAVDPILLLANSTLLYSAEEVEFAIDALAEKINHQFKNTSLVLMCVMTGGLYFSGKLLSRLTMPVELDYVQANRYQKHLSGGELVWSKLPSQDIQQKVVLLVDDILDEGVTLSAVQIKCLALGAKAVHIVVLADKSNQYLKPIQADFVALTVPDLFVFGCGMDAHGWWRNLPEIRALK
jgi:hypoxanthine phosphoribosyltransferase